jgi:putative sporulation protein YyaC
MLDRYNPRKRPLIFLCIGTPLIPGDCLGPVTGSVLSGSFAGQTLSPMTIYGTLEMPVHALNVRHICRKIKKQHQKPFVIAIDAALGNTSQSGYILLKKGPLRPGKGVGKKLPPVGDLQITGIFQDIFALSASHQAAGFSRCISEGILEFYPSLQCPE